MLSPRRRVRAAVIFPSAVAGLFALVLPAAAADIPDDRARVVAEAEAVPNGPRSPGRVSSADDEGGLVVGAPGQSIVTDRETRDVAPGLALTSFDRLDPRGWIRGDVLTADLSTDGLSVDYLFPGAVTSPQPLSVTADDEDAVAGVNGDFFDIGNSGAARGVGLDRERGLLQAPVQGWNEAAAIGEDGLGRLAQVLLEGTVSTPGGPLTLAGVNTFELPRDGVGLYTPDWGSYTRNRPVSASSSVIEVSVVDGRVTAVSSTPGSGPIPEGTTILLGRDTGAEALARLVPGDAVPVAYRPRADVGEIAVAIGGNRVIVRDGVATPLDDRVAAPRTAVGFSADGSRMFLVTVDGRQADSRGMTEHETAVFMRDLGADDALNLDGGGSSTLLARDAGEQDVSVENSPSDGAERSVPNGLGLFSEAGSGRLAGWRVEPASQLPDAVRVFPGLTRRLTADGHDETFATVDAEPRWSGVPADVGRVAPSADGEEGVLTGRRAGEMTVRASAAGVTGELPVTVLGDLTRLSVDAPRVGLADAQTSGSVTVTGFDSEGYSAPVEAGDLSVSGGEGVVRLEPSDDATFTIEPLVDTGSALLEVTVGDVRTTVAVTIGLQSQVVADFADASAWTFSSARGTGSVAPTAGREDGSGLEITFDFARSTGTRTANATPPARIDLPGQPQAIGMWVNGDGQGEWTAFSLYDADGRFLPLYGPLITWTGWRYIEVPIPDGVSYPLQFGRFGALETKAARQYTGRLVVDDLTVKVPPDVELPAPARVTDPVIVQDGTVADAPQQIAVVSDAQFTAAAPDGPLVEAARRTLREAVAAKPDLIVINGDWVDTGYEADMDLARRVIEEEVGDVVPWYYNPGNHEILGPGTIDNFRAEFGETYRSFDLDGTRFVLLDTSKGTLRGGGFAQLQLLRSALDGAEADPAVTGVVVMGHHPPRDPGPADASQLADRKEAALVEQWLGEFRSGTGKGAAYVGSHAGVFDASAVDGVSYLVNGNAGKSPSSTPDRGGFTGWTLLGLDPSVKPMPGSARQHATQRGQVARTAWLSAEIRPRVDELELDVPATLPAGTTAPVSATVVQDGDRRVPVAWPVSADWDGSPSLHIGNARDAPARAVATYDPATGELAGLREGQVLVEVTVNGVSTQRLVTVKAAAATGTATIQPAA